MVTVDCHQYIGLTPSQVSKWWMDEMYLPYGGEGVPGMARTSST